MEKIRRDQIRKAFRGPVGRPALSFLAALYLLSAILFPKSIFALDFKSFEPYTPSSAGGDSRAGAERDSPFDAQRVMRRNLLEQRTKKEFEKQEQEKSRDTQHVQEIGQNVAQQQKASGDIAQQEQREADFIYGRTTGLDSFSMDKDGGTWRQHLAILVEAWNVLSRDLFGNESRSHMTDFMYNDLLNATGMQRETVDQAGRKTETVTSGITYMPGEALRNFLSENKEASRTEVTTTFHPTGNQVTRTEMFDLAYDGDKVISQKAKIMDFSGPNNPILQETFDMKYDTEGDVSHSKGRVTDLVTGVVTESTAQNTFSDHRLTSGVTSSTTKDFINHTLTYQNSAQTVSYEDGKVRSVATKGLSTAKGMDGEGNAVDDFVQTTETIQTMDLFKGIPNPVEIVSVSKTLDNIAVQTTESTQIQKHIRDDYGNLLNVTATEVATTANADRSVVQNTESDLEFLVRADQPYLTGRHDRSFTKDLITRQDITATSHFTIRLGVLGEVLEGMRIGKTHAANGDGSIVSDSESTQYFDRAAKVNALGLIRQESSSHTANDINHSASDEKRSYAQTHDDFNRVLRASETVKGHTRDLWDRVTDVEGSVEYAVGIRSNQPYAVRATNHITNHDPFGFLYTESTQTNTFTSDSETGKAIRGTGVTESVSKRMREDGTVLDILTTRSRAEETLAGLSQSNGFGLVSRRTDSETLDVLNHLVTHRKEDFSQEVNGVGKIQNAFSVAQATTEDENGSKLRETQNLVKTDFVIIGNDTFTKVTESLEVATDKRQGSYRVVTRKDESRYDPYGRILEIDDVHPEQSGVQVHFYNDVTMTPIPKNGPSMETLFQQLFRSGRP